MYKNRKYYNPFVYSFKPNKNKNPFKIGPPKKIDDHRRRLGNDFPVNHITDKRQYYREEYLKSDHWKNLKKLKFAKNKTCAKCNTDRFLDVHHLNYRNLYDVILDDLEILCRKCHKNEHKI